MNYVEHELRAAIYSALADGAQCTVICLVENHPTNTFVSKNISQASIYPSEVIEIEFHFSVDFFFHFHQISTFWSFYLMNYKKILHSLFWQILLKFMILHIKKTNKNKLEDSQALQKFPNNQS